MENAIIMASGLGTRMRPLTLETPKPLIKVNNIPMIETVIEGLKVRKSISKIYIVVGYLAEQFEYLKNKYDNVEIVYNKDYKTINNISSIYYAKEILKLGDTFICEADLCVFDKSIFNKVLKKSCYYGIMVKGYSEDWVFEQDNSGRIIRVGKKGTDCYNMVGIAFFLKEQGEVLSKAIDEVYGKAGYEKMFWDDVVNLNLDKLNLVVKPMERQQIVEIDTVEELNRLNIKLMNGDRL